MGLFVHRYIHLIAAKMCRRLGNFRTTWPRPTNIIKQTTEPYQHTAGARTLNHIARRLAAASPNAKFIIMSSRPMSWRRHLRTHCSHVRARAFEPRRHGYNECITYTREDARLLARTITIWLRCAAAKPRDFLPLHRRIIIARVRVLFQ